MGHTLAQVALHLHELETQAAEINAVIVDEYPALANLGVTGEIGRGIGIIREAREAIEEHARQEPPVRVAADDGQPYERCDLPTLDTILSANRPAEEPAVSLLDWVVRVWKLDRQGRRAKAHSSSHVFIDEDKGRDYFTRSVKAHQAKANRTDACYAVVLATQDPRDWKKADERGWTEHEETVVRKAGR